MIILSRWGVTFDFIFSGNLKCRKKNKTLAVGAFTFSNYADEFVIVQAFYINGVLPEAELGAVVLFLFQLTDPII